MLYSHIRTLWRPHVETALAHQQGCRARWGRPKDSHRLDCHQRPEVTAIGGRARKEHARKRRKSEDIQGRGATATHEREDLRVAIAACRSQHTEAGRHMGGEGIKLVLPPYSELHTYMPLAFRPLLSLGCIAAWLSQTRSRIFYYTLWSFPSSKGRVHLQDDVTDTRREKQNIELTPQVSCCSSAASSSLCDVPSDPRSLALRRPPLLLPPNGPLAVIAWAPAHTHAHTWWANESFV